MKRSPEISLLRNRMFDLLIIGGGITGAGILREAAQRGYSCLLVEKGDFASGTSSKSAKLIHGGIRYLKYGKIGMIKESLDERNYLLKTYPHLVKPLPFLFPVYDSAFKYKVGMAIYHFLGKEEMLPDYRYITTEEIMQIFPAIEAEGLKGGFIYYDAVTNDARLCNEVIAEAQQAAGVHALNYCEAISAYDKENHATVICRDQLTGEDLNFSCRCIINATGVWTDETLKRLTQQSTTYTAPSKGIHLVLSRKRFPADSAVIIPSYTDDDRLLYSLPWENNSVIIGTTDTDFNGDADNLNAEQHEIDYLLTAINRFTRGLKITRNDVLYTYAGLRPMYNDTAPSYERSRDYRIWQEGKCVYNILGGKLTGFHSMAEALLDELANNMPSGFRRKNFSIHTGEEKSPVGLPGDFIEQMRERYLEKAIELFAIARENPKYIERLHPDFDVTAAEAIYYIRHRQCCHLDDLLTRRLSVSYVLNGSAEKKLVIKKAAQIMQEICGWNNDEMKREIEYYNKSLQISVAPAYPR